MKTLPKPLDYNPQNKSRGLAGRSLLAELMKPEQNLSLLPIEELKNSTLTGIRVSETDMVKLICIHCFRLGSSKPLIGRIYANITVLQSNLLHKIKSDQKNVDDFLTCWQKMVRTGAISVFSGNVCSLNPKFKDIPDTDIKASVDWTFTEHRRISGTRGC